MIRRLLWDNKVPGTTTGTRVAAAPGLAPAGSAAGFLEDSQVNGALPCQAGRFELHQDGPGGNKDKVANTWGRCVPNETVDAGWEELGPDGP